MKKLLSGLLGLALTVVCFLPAIADTQTHLGQVVSYRLSQRGDWFFLKFRSSNDGVETEEIQIGPLDKAQTAVYADVLSENTVHAYRVTIDDENMEDDDQPTEYYDFFVMK